MKKNIILLSLMILPWLAQAQYNRCGIKLPSKAVLDKIKHKHSHDHMHSFRSVDEAANYISRIVDQVPDWEQNFVVQERNGINNAYAHISRGRRTITYDNIFVESLDFQAGTKWASISVLAHEVGHHYYDHVLDRRGSTPPKEIEADYFSGYVLAKMGASLNEAKAAMAKLASPYGSSTHPARNQRLAAIEKGWRDAKPRKKSTMISGNYYSQQKDIQYVQVQQRSSNTIVATWVFDNGQKSSANLQYKRNAYNGAKVYAANYMRNTRRVELYFFKDGRIRERDIDLKTRRDYWYNFSKH